MENLKLLNEIWTNAHVKYGESIDFAPYTPMFDFMYMQYIAKSGDLMTQHEFWCWLLTSRKNGKKLLTQAEIKARCNEGYSNRPKTSDAVSNGSPLLPEESWLCE